ncbi:hypothetical protein SAMN05444162_3946 [Paenibacillaceae bacterium GAS479]|nr:hypothetical protein SAMN05444162_3946 [Paenibacillaceae bacterium GAS479]
MKLFVDDFEIIRGKGTTCSQDMIISVSNYWGLNYELFFCENMSFKFQFEEGKKLGDCLITKRSTEMEYSGKHHGLLMQYDKYTSSSETLSKLRSSVKEKKLASIYLDAFYTRWNPHGSYLKAHGDHHCLVVDYCDKKSIIYCIDPVYSKKIEELSYDDFLLGNNGGICFFEKVKPIELDFKATKKIINRIKEIIEKENNLSDILVFSEKMIDCFNMKKEISGTSNFWTTKIWIGLDKVIFGRYYFYKFVKFFSQYYSPINLIEQDALSSYRKWEMIRSIITKLYYTNKNERRIIETISKLLQEIYIHENAIHEFLLLDGFPLQKNGNIILYEYSKDNLIEINLKEFHNNRSFYIENSAYTVEADFNGEGKYMILTQKELSLFNISDEGDNVKCEKQLIKVPNGRYSNIFLKGCSEFGGSQTEIILYYKDANHQKYTLYFSDWEDGEDVEMSLSKYWIGRNDKNRIVFIKELAIKIDSSDILEAIELPFYPNLHIFALELS